MEHCCHIWEGVHQYFLPNFEKVQKQLRGLVGDELFASLQPLPQKRNVAKILLLYCYYHGKWSYELHPVVIPVKTFAVKSLQVMRTGANHYYCLRVSLVRRTASFQGPLLCETSSRWDSSLAKIYSSRVNRFLSDIFSWSTILTSVKQTHSISLYFVWFLGLGLCKN